MTETLIQVKVKVKAKAKVKRGRRLAALLKKEFLQIIRDPSSMMIAFVLPLVLIFLFGYGLSLDARNIDIGIVLEDPGWEARDLAMRFFGNAFFVPTVSPARQDLLPQLVTGGLKTVLVVPVGFSAAWRSPQTADLSLVMDGTFPNTASMVQNYSLGVIAQWTATRGAAPVMIESRFWYNNELESRYSIIPGIVAMVMALIGTMLTALVIAREWERGTMEALLATPVSALEILLGKLIPYYLLAMLSTFFCLALSVGLFGIPYRGSLLMLYCVGSLFMLSALGQGLIISTLAKNQYVASFAALLTAFLPAVLLSGFIFEINSMPLPQRAVSALLPARYLVTCLQTLFLAGDVWSVLIPNMLKLGALGVLLLGLTLRRTRKRLF